MTLAPRRRLALPAVLCALVTALGGEPYRPAIDPANFTHLVTHPYFPLVPGTTLTFLEKGPRDVLENKWTVTRETRTILGVKCVKVHDTVTQDGALREETDDWYAQDRQGAVWCFGEETQEYKVGGRVSTLGSWLAGVNGAQPGIVMPARPRVGERYRQQYAANVAEDIGQIAALEETVTVPAGTFTGCLRTREWSMLESGTSKRWYARGLGLVRDESTGGDISTLLSVKRP